MEQGEGKQSVGRKVDERRFGHFQRLRESLFSVFIDNIPGDKDASWLRKLFEIAGKTMDVFIPLKERRATNSRFGFVRFKELEEAQEAIRRWNGSLFGRCRLIVKLADYGGKPKISLKGVGVCQQRKALESLSSPIQFKEAGVVGPSDVGFQFSSKKRKILLEVIPENEEWLLCSAVAVLKAFIPPSQLEEELKLNGIKLHKIFPFGGKKVLIHFSSMNDLESCLSGSFSSLSRRFSSLHKWKEEVPSRLRSVWLSIVGLPFKAWSDANFQKIVEPLGIFLKTELRDFQESGLERVRVLVETERMDRIFEVFEAEVGGKVAESVICEECFFNGRETEWKVEESSDDGEEAVVASSFVEGLISNGHQQGVVKQGVAAQGGVRVWGSDGESSYLDSSVAKSVPPGQETPGTLEAFHFVPDAPLGVEETYESSLVRSAGKEKDLGKLIAISEVSENSWDITLSSFLQRREVGCAGKESCGQLGLGSSSPCLEEEGMGNIGVCSTRPVSLEGASKRLANQKSSLAGDFDAKAHNSSKVLRRKESKGKAAFKVQRRKKRAELDRLKKSYFEELEKSKKTSKLSEAVRQNEEDGSSSDEEARDFLQRKEVKAKEKEDIRYQRKENLSVAGAGLPSVEGHGLNLLTSGESQVGEEDERRRIVRKEAEFTFRIASRLGIKGNLPEEEMIQFFENLHNEIR